MDRRRLVGAGAGAIAAMAIPVAMRAQDDGGPGEIVAGGGAVETPLGLVDFGFVARVDGAGKVTGSFAVQDFTQPGNPVVLQSTQLNRMEALAGDSSNARQIVGWVSAPGATVLFVLEVDDVDGPGSGKDVFRLRVGEAASSLLEGEEQRACDCADYSYAVEGPVVQGDILVVAGQVVA